MVITIDGPSASGKSSVARSLAHSLSLSYLGTGYLFRAAAYVLYKNHPAVARTFTEAELAALATLNYSSTDGVICITTENHDITKSLQIMPEIDRCASLVGADCAVRQELLKLFRAYGLQHQKPGIVADGRDCGTVIFPKADIKFYLTASPRVRAERVLADPARHNDGKTLEQVEAAIAERDIRDSTRAIAPLIPATDAYVLDNSTFSLEQTLQVMLAHVATVSVR